MRIIDEHGNELKEADIDLTCGRLVDDWALKPGVAEVDFVTKHKYADGDFEQVKRYIVTPKTELRERRIAELKRNLENTDYMILKVVEGATTLSEIAEAVTKRAAWRKEINELEKEG